MINIKKILIFFNKHINIYIFTINYSFILDNDMSQSGLDFNRIKKKYIVK